MLDFEQIKTSLSQRFPLLLVDKIIELEEGKRVVGLKNITGNEICFLGHFPDRAIFPGTMVIEAAAQVSTFLFYREKDKTQKLDFYLGVVKDMRFLKPLFPGDQLKIEALNIRLTENTAYFSIKGFANDVKVCEGDLVFVRRI